MAKPYLSTLKTELLVDMYEYMADLLADGAAPGYTAADITRCESILDRFLEKVRNAQYGDRLRIMAAIREAVEALNQLNQQCTGCLIETDQREQLCELIHRACTDAGLPAGEDLTLSWRQW